MKCQGVSVVVQLLALERPMLLQMQAAAILQVLLRIPLACCSSIAVNDWAYLF